MDPNEQILEAIRLRTEKAEPFRYGLMTADRHVKSIEDLIGIDGAYRFFARGNKSYDDLIKAAKQTLVYSNEDMDEVEDTAASYRFKQFMQDAPDGVEMPKNALMVFKFILSSSRKDRDGDILHSDGAKIDPKMLLLWQHVHTAPLGPYLYTVDQNPSRIKCVSAIVDINDLCHDCAVMVDNKMARFSHGFRAISFSKTKESNGREGSGFDVRSFEVMEHSMVTVPANPDAEQEDIILSLVGGKKLKSAVMRGVADGLKERRPLSVQGTTIPINLKVTVDVENKGAKDENKSAVGTGTGTPGTGEGRDGTGAPRETDGQAGARGGEGQEKATKDQEGLKTKELAYCPFCEEIVDVDDDGKCPECGHDLDDEDKALAADGASGGVEAEPIPFGGKRKPKRPKVETKDELNDLQLKPYPNEHSARQADPDKFKKFRRQNDKFGKGIDVVWGIDEDGKTAVQSIRFDASKFTADKAKKWLKDNDFSASNFVAAETTNKDTNMSLKDFSPGMSDATCKITCKTFGGFGPKCSKMCEAVKSVCSKGVGQIIIKSAGGKKVFDIGDDNEGSGICGVKYDMLNEKEAQDHDGVVVLHTVGRMGDQLKSVMQHIIQEAPSGKSAKVYLTTPETMHEKPGTEGGGDDLEDKGYPKGSKVWGVGDDEGLCSVEMNEIGKKEAKLDGEKSGRVLSSKNMESIKSAHSALQECKDKHDLLMTAGIKGLVNKAHGHLNDVLTSATGNVSDTDADLTGASHQPTVKDLSTASAIVLAKASSEQRQVMIKALLAIEEVAEMTGEYKEFREAIGASEPDLEEKTWSDAAREAAAVARAGQASSSMMDVAHSDVRRGALAASNVAAKSSALAEEATRVADRDGTPESHAVAAAAHDRAAEDNDQAKAAHFKSRSGISSDPLLDGDNQFAREAQRHHSEARDAHRAAAQEHMAEAVRLKK